METDVENLLDELNGRLTAVMVKNPGTEPFIESLRKHIRFALSNPKEARLEKLLKKSREWLNLMAWKHPMFRDEFLLMVKKIDECRHSSS